MARHFTKEEIQEIRKQLEALAIHDVQLPITSTLNPYDTTVFVKEGKNVRISLSELKKYMPGGSEYLAKFILMLNNMEVGRYNPLDVDKTFNLVVNWDTLGEDSMHRFLTDDMISKWNTGVDLSSFFNGVNYNRETKKIEFKNGNTIVAWLDATDFIKDGMVSDVRIDEGNIVITFNTDSGQEPIYIALTDIFDPSNYYTKEQTNTAINEAFKNYKYHVLVGSNVGEDNTDKVVSIYSYSGEDTFDSISIGKKGSVFTIGTKTGNIIPSSYSSDSELLAAIWDSSIKMSIDFAEIQYKPKHRKFTVTTNDPYWKEDDDPVSNPDISGNEVVNVSRTSGITFTRGVKIFYLNPTRFYRGGETCVINIPSSAFLEDCAILFRISGDTTYSQKIYVGPGISDDLGSNKDAGLIVEASSSEIMYCITVQKAEKGFLLNCAKYKEKNINNG